MKIKQKILDNSFFSDISKAFYTFDGAPFRVHVSENIMKAMKELCSSANTFPMPKNSFWLNEKTFIYNDGKDILIIEDSKLEPNKYAIAGFKDLQYEYYNVSGII